jgi:hypothetical protein
MVVFGAGAWLVMGAACAKPEAEAPPAELKPVEAYGLTLDESATPQQVAFAFLRSVADDVEAAQARPRRTDDQKKATHLTHALAAYPIIERRLLDALGQSPSQGQAATLGEAREHELFQITRLWAPIVSHYVRSFDREPRAAMDRMWTLIAPDRRSASVFYDVEHDPAQPDPAQRQTATVEIELAKVGSVGRMFWRVARVGYLGVLRPEVRVVEAFGVRLDEKAEPEQAAFVLLRSLAEQARLTESGTKSERRAVLMRAYSLLAYPEMDRLIGDEDASVSPADEKSPSRGTARDRMVLNTIGSWGPHGGEVLRDFSGSFEQLRPKLRVDRSDDGKSADVSYSAMPGASGGSSDDDAVVVELARTSEGANMYWRVKGVSFRRADVAGAAPETTQPARATGPQ